MAAQSKGEGQTALPPMSVGRVADCMRLVEALVSENIELFGGNIAKHRDARRQSSERPLSGIEAAGVAAALGVDPESDDAVKRIEEVQASGLTATDEVPMQEVLLVAGVSTAPAAIEAACKLVVLVEMPDDEYRAAREAGEDKLREAIDKAAKAFELDTPAGEGRERGKLALDHFQIAAGVDSGEARSLIFRTVLEALGQAVENSPKLGSTLASLTGSLEPTDGTAEPSSTTPSSPTPSS